MLYLPNLAAICAANVRKTATFFLIFYGRKEIPDLQYIMSAKVRTIQCPSCGAPSSPRSKQCDYCGNYLLHLTQFEKRSSPANEDSGADFKYFHSLRTIYRVVLYAGILMAVVIYGFFFNTLSEDELVMLSPIWFLLMVFGACGLYAEKAVMLILEKEAKTFPDALGKAIGKLKSPLNMIFIVIIFALPGFVFGIRRNFSSPLIISGLTTLIWGAALYIFLVGIFPSM